MVFLTQKGKRFCDLSQKEIACFKLSVTLRFVEQRAWSKLSKENISAQEEVKIIILSVNCMPQNKEFVIFSVTVSNLSLQSSKIFSKKISISVCCVQLCILFTPYTSYYEKDFTFQCSIPMIPHTPVINPKKKPDLSQYFHHR